MNKKRKIIIFMLFIFFALNMAHCEEILPIEIQYILKSQSTNGNYNLFLKNYSNHSNEMDIYLNGIIEKKLNPRLTNNTISISNYFQNSGILSIERFKNLADGNGSPIKISESKSDEILIRNLDKTYLLGDYFIENIGGKDIYTLNLKSNINISNYEYKKYTLDINGVIYPLEYDNGIYEEGKYYISEKKIKFYGKNLTERISNIVLIIDGLKSNFITINKTVYNIQSIRTTEISQSLSTRDLRIYIYNNDTKLGSLNNIDFFMNNQKIDPSNITIFGGEIIIKIDIFEKKDDVIEIYFKNNNDNTYSNKIHLKLSKYFNPIIKRIDLGNDLGKFKNFNFNIIGNDNSFFGDLHNFSINLNGTGFSLDGEKEYLKDTNGVILKDTNGTDRYKINNSLDIKRTSFNNLSFNYFIENLKNENLLFLENKNYDEKSNIVYFSKDLKKVDYNYSDAEKTEEKKETIIYTPSINIEKKIDFLQNNQKNFDLGKLDINNLKSDSYYKISFEIDSNSLINPFSNISFGDFNKNFKKTNNGINYIYEKIGFGKDFSNNLITFNINELYNIDNPINLVIKNIKIDTLDDDSNYVNIFSDKIEKNVSLFYKYTVSECFDGKRDFCDALNLGGGDSYLDFILTFKKITNQLNENKDISDNDLKNEKDSNVNTKISINKNFYIKQIILSKNNLNKSGKYKKYILSVDKLVDSLNFENSKKIFLKIEKLNKTNLGDSENVIYYLEAKLAIKILELQ